MHNRLSVRRYSVSTGAYILIVVQELGLQRVRKGMVPHEVYNVALPHCKAQWPVEYQRKIEEERYQEQKHNMRITCVSPTTKMNRNRTRGVTQRLFEKVLSDPKNGLRSSVSHWSLLGALGMTSKGILLITLPQRQHCWSCLNHQRISRGNPEGIGNPQRTLEGSFGGVFGGGTEERQLQESLEEVFSVTLALELVPLGVISKLQR